MTALAYNTPFYYGSTADFRAWGSAMSAKLQAAGLYKDPTITGQINWSTVNTPVAINTPAGYEVYRFDDALQATAPVYIKIEYGHPGALSVPGIWLTVASSCLANGTMTGIVGTRQSLGTMTGVASAVRPYLSNVCVLPGYVFFMHKREATSNAYYPNANFFFAVCRTVDDAANNTGDGVFTLASATVVDTAPNAQCIGFAGAGYVTAWHPGFAGLPGNQTASNAGQYDIQMYKSFGVYPKMRPNPYICLYYRPEIQENIIIRATMQGAAEWKYLATGLSSCRAGWWATDTNRSLAFRYE